MTNLRPILKKYLLKFASVVVIFLVIVPITRCLDEKNTNKKMAELEGNWQCETTLSDTWRDFLIDFDFYEEELKLLDNNLASSYVPFVYKAMFTHDKKYVMNINEEKTIAVIKETLIVVFDTLYEHREQLSDVYDMDFSDFTDEEFKLTYAQMYEHDTFEELIDDWARGFAESFEYEQGTYRIVDNYILFTREGETSEEKSEYSIEDGVLYLTVVTEKDNSKVIAYKRIQ